MKMNADIVYTGETIPAMTFGKENEKNSNVVSGIKNKCL
jgi:hypothetical protein